MRIFCPYTDVQNATLTALAKYFWSELIFADVTGEWAYVDFLKQRWIEQETFISIEHDVVPWYGAIEEIWDCPHEWCDFTYYSMPGEPHPPPVPIGLVKFRPSFLEKTSGVWDDFVNRYDELKGKWDPERKSFPWNHLDMHLYEYAGERGLRPHEHWPSVVNAKPMYRHVTETLGARFITGGDPLLAPKILDYDLTQFDFAPLVREILGIDDLTKLSGEDFGVTELLTDATNQHTLAHKAFYAAFEAKMGTLYRQLVKSVSESNTETSNAYYQTVPTLRIHFPNNLAVGAPHTDRERNHQEGEINFWLPLTPAYDTNTLYIEQSRGAQNYRPWELNPGQMLMFDAVNWSHCNMRNKTDASRVSMDFRLIPKDKYQDTGLTSVNGCPMTVGRYWADLN